MSAQGVDKTPNETSAQRLLSEWLDMKIRCPATSHHQATETSQNYAQKAMHLAKKGNLTPRGDLLKRNFLFVSFHL